MKAYRPSKSKKALKILFENKFLLSRNGRKISHNNIKNHNSNTNTNSIFIQRPNALKSLKSSNGIRSTALKKNTIKILKNCSSAYSSKEKVISKSDNKKNTKLNHGKHKSLNLNRILRNIKNELSLEKENRELKRKILLLEKENSILFKKNQRYKYLETIQNTQQFPDIDKIDASYNYYVTTGNSNENNKTANSFNSNNNVINIIYKNQNKKITNKNDKNKCINIINNYNKNYSYLTIDSGNVDFNSRSRILSGLYNLKNLNNFKPNRNSLIKKLEVKEKNNNVFKSINNKSRRTGIKEINLTNKIGNNRQKIKQINQVSIESNSRNIHRIINVNKRKNICVKFGTGIETKNLSSQNLFNSMNKLMERTRNLLISYNNLSRDLSKTNLTKK